MTSRIRTTSLLIRHLRAHSAGGVTLAILIVVLAAIGTASPRLVAAMHSSAISADLGSTDPFLRDIDGLAVGSPEPGPSAGASTLPSDVAGVWGSFDAQVDGLRSTMSPTLRGITAPADYLAATDPRSIYHPGSGRHLSLSLAMDPREEDHVHFTSGGPAAPGDANGVEIALSTATALAMEWTVGDTKSLLLDGATLPVTLVGLFDADDPGDDYWAHAPLVLDATVTQMGLGPTIYNGTALISPLSLSLIPTLGMASRLNTWFGIDAAQVDVTNAAEVARDIRRFLSRSPQISVVRPSFGDAALAYRSGTPELIDASLGTVAATDAVLAMTVSGPLGLVLAVLILAGRVIAERRTGALRLLSARGASPGRLRALMAAEGLVVGVPAAVVGALIGIAATTGSVTAGVLVLPAIIGLLPALILTIPATRLASRRVRTDLGSPARGRFRLVGELVLVGLAAVATAALTQRGIVTASDGSGVDPLLVAVPLLLALAACVVALRLYPIPLKLLADAHRDRAGLIGFLGPIRALRDAAAGLVPVLALVIGVAVAVSSGVLLSTLQDGIDTAAETAVGADLRISNTTLGPDDVAAVKAIPGIAASATATEPATSILDADGRRSNTAVVIVDFKDLAEVQHGLAGALPVPRTQSGKTIPVIASSSVVAVVGSSSDPSVNGEPITIAATIDGPTALSTRANWILADSSATEALSAGDAVVQVMLLRLEPNADPTAVTTAIRRVVGDGAAIDAPREIASIRESTASTIGLRTALLVAILLTSALSALAIAMTLVRGSRGRERILGLLRLLGARRGVPRTVAAWEIGPPAVMGVVVGTLFGLALPVVILSAVDLRPFTGGLAVPGYSADVGLTTALVGGFAVVTVLFTTAGLALSRRAGTSNILRTVEDE